MIQATVSGFQVRSDDNKYPCRKSSRTPDRDIIILSVMITAQHRNILQCL